MTRVERRDAEPEKKPEQKPAETGGGGKVSRREFLEMAGTGIVGLAIGGVVGSQLFPKKVEVAAPAEPAPEAAPAAAPAAAAAPKAGMTIIFDPVHCTGCQKCARACSEHWMAELFPEETKNTVNYEFSRIRPMRFEYVDVINICQDCKLVQWSEGSEKAPCEQVCPQQAIIFVPEGEGKVGFTGMGYKTIDREKCLGLDKCWRCAEICEDQFASGISFIQLKRKPRYAHAAAAIRHASKPAPSRWRSNGCL